MKFDDVVAEITSIVEDISSSKDIDVSENSTLIGENRILDSLGLVELCLRLEEMSQEFGFEFDWTSSTAMSASKSMFRSVGTLATEFVSQSAESKP